MTNYQPSLLWQGLNSLCGRNGYKLLIANNENLLYNYTKKYNGIA